jgi:hypothetical protein
LAAIIIIIFAVHLPRIVNPFIIPHLYIILYILKICLGKIRNLK